MAKNNVSWDSELLTDADNVQGDPERFTYYHTDRRSLNIPESGREPQNHKGFLFYLKDNDFETVGNVKGLQYWYDTFDGDIYARHGEHLGTGQMLWTQWVKKSSQIQPTHLSNFLMKPESQDQIVNIDEPTESGFMKTGDKTVSGNLPDGVDAKWGLVVNLFENKENKTMFQMWFSLSGKTKGHRYTRGRENRQWTKWVDISNGQPSINNYWELPSSTIAEVNGQLETGYYKTTESTTGMEGVPQGRRDGIVKIIKDGDLSIQEYTPSYTDDLDYYVRNIPVTASTARSVPNSWTRMGKESTIPIRKESITVQMMPHDYATLGDQVIYQFAFPDTVGLTADKAGGKAIDGFVVIMTIIADDITTDGHNTQEQKFGFISQYAYTRSGRVFVRFYNHKSAGQLVEENAQWTKDWQELKKGSGGTGVTMDAVHSTLAGDFESWANGGHQQDAFEKAVIKFHKNSAQQTYEYWLKRPTGSEEADQVAFNNYIKKIAPSGKGLDFSTWLTFEDKQ